MIELCGVEGGVGMGWRGVTGGLYEEEGDSCTLIQHQTQQRQQHRSYQQRKQQQQQHSYQQQQQQQHSYQVIHILYCILWKCQAIHSNTYYTCISLVAFQVHF